MPNYQDIRIIDLFKAVMERPYLYTLHGTYQEAISYLKSYYNGSTHHRIDESLSTSDDILDLQRYRSFASWLAERYGVSADEEAFRRLGEQTERPLEAVPEFYREFKKTV